MKQNTILIHFMRVWCDIMRIGTAQAEIIGGISTMTSSCLATKTRKQKIKSILLMLSRTCAKQTRETKVQRTFFGELVMFLNLAKKVKKNFQNRLGLRIRAMSSKEHLRVFAKKISILFLQSAFAWHLRKMHMIDSRSMRLFFVTLEK